MLVGWLWKNRPWRATRDAKTDSENTKTTSVTQLINIMTTTMTMMVAAATWLTVRWRCWRRLLRCNRSCFRRRIFGFIIIIIINTVLRLAVNSSSDFKSRPSKPAPLIVKTLKCLLSWCSRRINNLSSNLLYDGRSLKQLKMCESKLCTHPEFHISANKLLRINQVPSLPERLPNSLLQRLPGSTCIV